MAKEAVKKVAKEAVKKLYFSFFQWHLPLLDDLQFSEMNLYTVLDLNLMGLPGRFACRLDNLQVLLANLVFAVL